MPAYGFWNSPTATAMASAMNTTAETVLITTPTIASGWRRSAARLDTGSRYFRLCM